MAVYAGALKDAGFADVAVVEPELSSAPDGRDDRDHWSLFLRYDPAVLIDCRKA